MTEAASKFDDTDGGNRLELAIVAIKEDIYNAMDVAFAREFPEAQSGDCSPEMMDIIDSAVRQFVTHWVWWNC